MAHHHLASTPETIHWGYWDASLAPRLTIASGDRVTVETISGGPQEMPPSAAGFTILPEHPAVLAALKPDLGPHLLTGPIAVAGAEPGDVLAVHIEAIEFRQDWGWNLVAPLLGTLPEDFPDRHLIHVPIDAARGTVTMPWGQELRTSSFFGCMGVAPAPAWGRLASVEPRVFGGNMDNKELVAGTTVYFPVFAPGALFSVGDGHALQGDGEVCITAIETALTGTFRFELLKGRSLTAPRAETPTAWITMGFDVDLDQAVKQALRDMIRLIGAETGLSPVEAYVLSSIAADLRVTQTVDVHKGIHCVIEKSRLPAPRPEAAR